MSVKFLDLGAQYQTIKEDIHTAIQGVLASSHYVLGPEVEAFEKEFASLHKAKFAVAVNSGTSALHLALLANGIGPGDEVITVAMTFTATAAAIVYTGAIPVFVDVDPVTFTMDPTEVQAKISGKTRAILPVHLYGHPADLDPLLQVAKKHGLKVIEDAAQAHLAEYKKKPVGSFGDAAAFSFYPGKNLGAYGEGGIITTNNTELAEQMRLLRDWGQTKKYHHEILAYNYRMDAIQGAILRVKLRALESWTMKRRKIADWYRNALKDLKIQTAQELQGNKHVYHIFSAFHPDRNTIQKKLKELKVETGNHYPVPIHRQKAYEKLGLGNYSLPVTEKTANEQFSLPIYPEMNENQISEVADALKKCLRF